MNPTSPIGKPWRVTGTTMAPSALLMCKFLLLLLLIHGYFFKISDPYLPFIRALDHFRSVPGLFEILMKSCFALGALGIVLNYRVRSASLLLGMVVLLYILASKPMFRNHVFIVACLFLLAGCHRNGEFPWLIRYQFVVMYLGAAISKTLDYDWWSGSFMHTWLHTHLANPYYEALSPLLPAPLFAVLISWGVIASEILLFFLFLVPRWNRWGIWISVAMHLSFFILIPRVHFGHFTEDILIALLAFLCWPMITREIRFPKSTEWFFKPVLYLSNLDRQFLNREPLPPGGPWLEIRDEDINLRNVRALMNFLKYNPTFYFGIFVAYHGLLYVLPRF